MLLPLETVSLGPAQGRTLIRVFIFCMGFIYKMNEHVSFELFSNVYSISPFTCLARVR